jgi:hypothetical protein
MSRVEHFTDRGTNIDIYTIIYTIVLKKKFRRKETENCEIKGEIMVSRFVG